MKKRHFGYTLLLVTLVIIFIGCNKNFKNSKATGANASDTSNEEKVDSAKLGEYEIAFSKPGYFYSDDIKIGIKSNKPCKIYYTTDGKNPDKKQTLYEKEINLTAEEKLKVVSIKAKAYYEDGKESKTIVHTYFLSTKVNDRFDTLVFSITTDPYNLYDYNYGIFVKGKLRDDYVKEHPNEKIDPPAPANYNMRGKESERPVYLEIFEPDGTNIAKQDAGIRTYGGWSRDSNQKPIKIYTRKEYDKTNNKIRYEFFPQKTAASGDGTILDSFNRLVLRNSGNDNGIAFIRDELFQTLASQGGYTDYEAVRPAALFINGEYRGFYWLHENYCDEYFEENYGEYTGKFEVLEGEETVKEVDTEGKNKAIVDEYDKMYKTYSKMDLTVDKNYNELCKLVDVENYLSYFALQIYLGNGDWPHNNYKTYRYYPIKGEKFKSAPFDGKWRYLLHDLDFTFSVYGKGPLVDNIQDYVGGDGQQIMSTCPLFGQLMKRKDCKEIFIKKTADLINGALAPANINKVLRQMDDARSNELNNTYGKNIISNWVKADQMEGKLDIIRDYGKKRAEHILTKYQEFFRLGNIYQLRVQPEEGCSIKINTFTTDKYFEGKYYDNYTTKISAVIPAGKELDYWLCNGDKVYTDILVIDSSKIKADEAVVTFVLKEESKNPHLIISELSEDKDYMEVYNPYKQVVSTKGYTISDTSKNKQKYILPEKKLAQGEKLTITCVAKKDTGKKVSNQTSNVAPFGLKTGETITLYKDSNKIDKVKVPKIKKENIYQRNLSSMRFYEIKAKN